MQTSGLEGEQILILGYLNNSRLNIVNNITHFEKPKLHSQDFFHLKQFLHLDYVLLFEVKT